MTRLYKAVHVTGPMDVSGKLWQYTGSLQGTASHAISASWSPVESLSFNESISRNYTGSFAGLNNFYKTSFYPISEWQNLPSTIYGGRYNDLSFYLNLTENSKNILRTSLPIRYYNVAGTYNYGIVKLVDDANTTIFGYVYGAPIDTSHQAYMNIAGYDKVIKLMYNINGWFADGVDSALITNDLYSASRWEYGKAYLVKISHKARVQDSGATQPKVNITLGGRSVCTSNSSTGRAISTSWVNTDIDISTTNYYVGYEEPIEITVTGDGTNKDAQDLTVVLTFVLE